VVFEEAAQITRLTISLQMLLASFMVSACEPRNRSPFRNSRAWAAWRARASTANERFGVGASSVADRARLHEKGRGSVGSHAEPLTEKRPTLNGVDFRRARRLLKMPQYIAAAICGLSQTELNEIERGNLALPQVALDGGLTINRLASQIRQNLPKLQPSDAASWKHNKLSFTRPNCPHCNTALRSHHHSERSESRGRYWRFECPSCDRRFWSTDGTPHPVGRGAWKVLADRVRCPDCDVDCVTAASPGKRSVKRFWRCPKCDQRYRSENGIAVLTQPGGHPKLLPFLPDRNCPKCEAGHLYIKGRPETA
jgi:transposase-like protein